MTLSLVPQQGTDSLRVFFHTGRAGYTSITMRLPDGKHSIILLSNIFNVPRPRLIEICESIIHILYGQPYKLPKPSVAVALRKSIEEKGVSQAIKQFPLLKQTYQADVQGNELNQLGYYYLNEKQFANAIEVLKLNMQEHPQDPNVYNSLAEAYLSSGDQERAIQYYQKAVVLDPNFESSVAALKRLKQKWQ